MKVNRILLAVLLTVMPWGAMECLGQAGTEQAFLGAIGKAGGMGAASAADSGFFASGTRAINEGRWSDAVSIFKKVSEEHGEHADGALYWTAYAENKQGQAGHALDTCGQLRREYPRSGWIDECGALEIEIRSRSGQPVQQNPGQDEDMKLLALNSLMRQDEQRALAQIQEILNGDSSEKLKKEALFILGNHYSDATYAQIVRLSYVEGDVRIARGEQNEKVTGATWEKAVSDLPLETGFSLATGAGRAEIELEDASTLYLGENSVLTFNDLHTTGGVPYSQVALLTGTATLHVRPYMAGEQFVLKTPPIPHRDLSAQVLRSHQQLCRRHGHHLARWRRPSLSEEPQKTLPKGKTMILRGGFGDGGLETEALAIQPHSPNGTSGLRTALPRRRAAMAK
jgi:hypothetical protein